MTPGERSGAGTRGEAVRLLDRLDGQRTQRGHTSACDRADELAPAAVGGRGRERRGRQDPQADGRCRLEELGVGRREPDGEGVRVGDGRVRRSDSWGRRCAGGFTRLSNVAFTAAASTGLPSLKVTPSRSTNVNALPSALVAKDFASHGTILPDSGSWAVSESTTDRVTSIALICPVCCGSRHPGSASAPTSRVPPSRGAPPAPPASPPPSEHAATGRTTASSAPARRSRRRGRMVLVGISGPF
ncbi:hypothetical protein STENM36S_09320 [Streptomyces tendae]